MLKKLLSHPEKLVLHVTGEMLNDDAETDADEHLLKKYEKADVLLLENVQNVQPPAKMYLQKLIEFFIARERQIVITSSVAPDDLPILEAGLKAQIRVGMVVEDIGEN